MALRLNDLQRMCQASKSLAGTGAVGGGLLQGRCIQGTGHRPVITATLLS